MKTRNVITALTILGFCVVSNCQNSISYVGRDLFALGENAVLQCSFAPVPEDIHTVEVRWTKTGEDGQEDAIAKSRFNPNASFVFKSAPAELQGRFSIDGQFFKSGQATATIDDITVRDASRYGCDVEAGFQQVKTNFVIDVYQLPTVKLEILQPVLDLLPKPASTGDDVSNGGNLTAVDDENDEGDSEVEIARCAISFAYPEPSRVLFGIQLENSQKMSKNGKIKDSVRNLDGTYNVTAVLELEPNKNYDGAVFKCFAYVADEKRSGSDFSEPISVLYPSSYTQMNVRLLPNRDQVNENTVRVGDRLEISCEADGNPPPDKFLILPNDRKEDVSEKPYRFKAGRRSAGAYVCIVNDGEGMLRDELQLSVLYMENPVITGPTRVRQNESASLNCRVETNARNVAISYYRNNELIYQNGANFFIQSVSPADAGVYECRAESDAGTASTQHTLDVATKCNPTVTKYIASSQTKAGEAYVILTCKAEGNPGCKMEMSSYRGDDPKTELNKATLTIPSLAKQMEPLKFWCKASNELSSNTVNFQLDHEDTCCYEPSTASLNGGVVVLIIVIVAFIVIAIPLLYCLLRRPRLSTNNNRTPNDDAEEALRSADEKELSELH